MKVIQGVRPIREGCRVVRRDGKVMIVHKGESKHVSRS